MIQSGGQFCFFTLENISFSGSSVYSAELVVFFSVNSRSWLQATSRLQVLLDPSQAVESKLTITTDITWVHLQMALDWDKYNPFRFTVFQKKKISIMILMSLGWWEIKTGGELSYIYVILFKFVKVEHS